MAHFTDQLALAVQRCRNPVVVGLDPQWEELPQPLRQGDPQSLTAQSAAYRDFCRGVIDVVAAHVPCVKLQAAFFEELGPPGMLCLGEVLRYAQERGLLAILDGKRNDIGSTAAAYARGYLGRDGSAWGADALTINPYLGGDSLDPFVEVARERGAGLFVLVKTSNPGGTMLQDLTSGGRAVFAHVADYVESLAEATRGKWGYGIVGAVVGATYPKQLSQLREAMPQTWFLVPGYGRQGGTAAGVAGAFDARGLGAIVNSARGIIFAHKRPEYAERFGDARWQEAVEAALREMIAQLRAQTPAGNLGRQG